MGRGICTGELIELCLGTLYRMLSGYLAGVIAGITIGILVGKFRTMDALLEPVIELIRPIPIPAIVPPLILLFGIDNGLKIFVVALACFFPVLINTIQGVRAVSPTSIEVARTFRRGELAVILRVILPAAMPYIAAGMRIALALALVVTIVAEMIAGSDGIGYYLITMEFAMRSTDMYAAILILAIIGYVLNRFFIVIERMLLPWFYVDAS